MAVTGLGGIAPATALTSAWTLTIPATVHALGTLGALPLDAAMWGEQVVLLLAGYLVAGALLVLARLVGFSRLPAVIGWAAGVGLLALMGLVQWWVSHGLAALVGSSLSGLAGWGPVMAALVWVVAGAFGWSLVGRITEQARRVDKLRRVSSKLSAMEQADRVRLEGSLRGMLTSLGRQVSRVVTDVTLSSPVDEVEYTRSLPDSTNDFVAPLTTRVSRAWAPEAQTDDAPPKIATVITPPGPIAIAALVIVSALATGNLSASSALPIVLAALISGGVAAVAWWWIPRKLDHPEQRLMVTIVASLVLAAAVLWMPVLLVTSLGGQMVLGWPAVVIAVVGVFGAVVSGTLAQRLAHRREVLANQVVNQVGRCDELGRKIAVVHQVDPRVLYSATLGTLIRTTVDLTATDVTEERRESALREMTRSITGELDTLRLQQMPLPDEQILGVLGMWRAAIGIEAEVSPSLFSRLAWSAEGIADLGAALGSALVWEAQQTRPMTTLQLASDGNEVTIDLAVSGLSPLVTVGNPGTEGPSSVAQWVIDAADDAGARGVVLRGRVVPRNGDQAEAIPRFGQTAGAQTRDTSVAEGLVESSPV